MAAKKTAIKPGDLKDLEARDKYYYLAVEGNKEPTFGLHIRVAPSGRKYWYSRVRRVYKKIPGGEWLPRDGMTFTEALKLHNTRRVTGSFGDDAELPTAPARVAEPLGYAVNDMVRDFGEAVSDDLKSWPEVDRCLKKYVLPVLGKAPANKVTRKDVIGMLAPLDRAGKKVQSNRVLSHLKRCYNWAIANGRFDDFDDNPTNPCALIEKHKEQSKDRYLTDTEIRRLLNNMPDSGLTEAEQDLLLLILLCGLRPGEAASARFDMVDEEAATLTLTDTKNERTHIVPLSPWAMEIVQRRKNDSGWLFPGRGGRRPVRSDRVGNSLRAVLPKLKVMSFTAHDLRRTCGTGLATLKCPDNLISLVLNHSIGGVTRIYNRYSYQDEMREALEAWADHVAGLLKKKPAKVRKVG